MNKKSKLALLGLLITIFSVLLVIAVSEIIAVMTMNNNYVFGSEVAGWVYASRSNFLIFNTIQILVLLPSIFALIRSFTKLVKS